MLIAEIMHSKQGWVLFIAPTSALVDQHLKDLKKVIKNIEPISITGSNIPKKREKLWKTSKIWKSLILLRGRRKKRRGQG